MAESRRTFLHPQKGTDMGLQELLIAMCIPSGICGFCFWLIERGIQKRDAAEKEERRIRQERIDERDKAREQCELYILKTVNASIALGEATARAVQRIPDAHCNGDMHAALDYAERVKHEQKDFINEQFVKATY